MLGPGPARSVPSRIDATRGQAVSRRAAAVSAATAWACGRWAAASSRRTKKEATRPASRADRCLHRCSKQSSAVPSSRGSCVTSGSASRVYRRCCTSRMSTVSAEPWPESKRSRACTV
eukprot:scaffold29558_cov146-Isochrysis_galbana.AAC.4